MVNVYLHILYVIFVDKMIIVLFPNIVNYIFDFFIKIKNIFTNHNLLIIKNKIDGLFI